MNKSNADLRRELEATKLKNELLLKQLQEATRLASFIFKFLDVSLIVMCLKTERRLNNTIDFPFANCTISTLTIVMCFYYRCIKSMAPTVAVALSNNNNNETSIKRNLKSKTRSGCGRLSPNQCILTADTQRAIGAFTRKTTKSYNLSRSNSTKNF